MPSATPQIHSPADEAVDHRLIEERAASVGHLFRDRVTATPDSDRVHVRQGRRGR